MGWGNGKPLLRLYYCVFLDRIGKCNTTTVFRQGNSEMTADEDMSRQKSFSPPYTSEIFDFQKLESWHYSLPEQPL